MLVVGAGPAGLAAAIRLGSARRRRCRAAAEALGEVPVAVLEKGKEPGSHLLSGAVLDPASLRRLLGDDDFPRYGEVPGEAVLFLTHDRAVRVPPPPTMRNHGNVVVSLSQLGRCAGGAGRGARRDGAARDGGRDGCSSRTVWSSACAPATRGAVATARSSGASSRGRTSARA